MSLPVGRRLAASGRYADTAISPNPKGVFTAAELN